MIRPFWVALACVLAGAMLHPAQVRAAEAVEPEPQLVGLRIQLVEMHPGAAIAGGYLDAKAIEAGNEGGTRISILTPAERADVLQLAEVVAAHGAKVVAEAELAAPSGQAAIFSQMAEAPFELLGETQIADESAAELDFPGQLGLGVRLTPTVDEKQRITLKIEVASRSAATWTATGQTETTQRRLRRGASVVTLRIVPETTVAMTPAMLEEDRRELASLGLADSVTQPFFAEPELGWSLYLLITPYLITDQ